MIALIAALAAIATPATAQVTARQAVAQEARARLGEQWVGVADRLAFRESGWRAHAVGPRTRHGRALGVLQVLPSSARALGYPDARRLLEPRYGAAAGVAHMVRCLRLGATTERLMIRCHNRGRP